MAVHFWFYFIFKLFVSHWGREFSSSFFFFFPCSSALLSLSFLLSSIFIFHFILSIFSLCPRFSLPSASISVSFTLGTSMSWIMTMTGSLGDQLVRDDHSIDQRRGCCRVVLHIASKEKSPHFSPHKYSFARALTNTSMPPCFIYTVCTTDEKLQVRALRYFFSKKTGVACR